ncbi:heavy metal-associated domain-containing protein [Enterococcus pseudoavium]|uniref:Heavy metal-associated domain-containing protein n=1 Tax=Enterococcus pseudoavium TaxID=44007 RepID=A0AAE4L1Z9_9ENTE|nr:heavy metal-associated domain-containing protein [Enterococcus pseudoavium]MDT2736128.1 heavy metal-associated domain-containing protein [Enterococcus pseudoavium]
MEKVIIQLGTLTCPSCLQKIEKAVGQQAGVHKVKVLFNASKVKAEIQSDQTTPETLQKVIEDLGYEVEAIKVKELS